MPQWLKRPSWLRIGVVLLTLIWYLSAAIKALGWMMLVYFIPLGALLVVAHWAAIKARDWFSLTLLGAFWGFWMNWGDRWWPGDSYDDTIAIAELWRQVRHDARYWIPSLVLAGGFYVWRASRPRRRPSASACDSPGRSGGTCRLSLTPSVLKRDDCRALGGRCGHGRPLPVRGPFVRVIRRGFSIPESRDRRVAKGCHGLRGTHGTRYRRDGIAGNPSV